MRELSSHLGAGLEKQAIWPGGDRALGLGGRSGRSTFRVRARAAIREAPNWFSSERWIDTRLQVMIRWQFSHVAPDDVGRESPQLARSTWRSRGSRLGASWPGLAAIDISYRRASLEWRYSSYGTLAADAGHT